MKGQRVQPRIVAPLPPNFAETFIANGWRAIERNYGASTPVLLRWIDMAGGKDLLRQRAEAQGCGRKCGGTVNARDGQG